jgi:NitT/TauT family transport system substrate-binding protein
MARIGWSALIALAAAAAFAGAAGAADKIKFATDGGPSGRHAYFFVAQDKGYFAAENLSVEIIGGRGSASVIKEVGAGSLDIGFADAGTLVLSRAKENVPVKLVAAVYRRAPHAMIGLKRPDLSKPADLMGKKLADTAGSSNVVMFPAYAKAAGFDGGKVEWIYTDFNALPGLLVTGQVDAIGQYTLGLPLLRKRAAPKELQVFAYRDGGLDFYSNGIVVRDDVLASKRDMVVRFTRAALKALAESLANPSEAAEIMHKHYPLLEKDIIAGEIGEVAKVAVDDYSKAHGLGTIEEAKVAKTIEIMAANYEMPRKISPADVADATVATAALGK